MKNILLIQRKKIKFCFNRNIIRRSKKLNTLRGRSFTTSLIDQLNNNSGSVIKQGIKISNDKLIPMGALVLKIILIGTKIII
tara:strand:- start:244 stop:489 length:246 start_codon:yes stop_codon:yes gene_type:complete